MNDTVKNLWFECIHRVLNICGFSNIYHNNKKMLMKNG